LLLNIQRNKIEQSFFAQNNIAPFFFAFRFFF